MDNVSSSAELDQNVQPQVDQNLVNREELERVKQETAKNSFKTGYEKARRELESQLSQNQSQYNNQPVQNQNNQSNFDPNTVRNILMEELNKRQEQERQQQMEEAGKQILQSLSQKALNAKQEIPDYDEVTSQINWQDVPQLLGYADSVDNGGHVMYHLAQNPLHIGSLLSMPPSTALAAIKRLSDSLKINKDSKNLDMPDDSLSRINSSAVGAGNKEMTIADYRRKYR